MKRKTLKQLIAEKQKQYSKPELEEDEDETETYHRPTEAASTAFGGEAMMAVASDHRTSVIAPVDLKHIADELGRLSDMPPQFISLPQGAVGELYRIMLRSTNADNMFTLELALCDDVVVGYQHDPDADVDLDLSPYVNRRFGISRRHALLRPSGSKVFLLDLNSTNGTRVNGSSVYPSRAMALQDGDIITLGSLTMTLSVQKAG